MKKHCLLYVAAVLLSGCAETERTTALHDFGVGNVPPAATGPGPMAGDVRVVAPKWLSDDRIRYRLLYDQPSRVRFYNLDRWIAPPPELLGQHFASGRFDSRYSLVIQVLNFEQQFEAPGSASVFLHVSVEAFAADGKKGVGRREFVLRSDKVAPDAQGAVQGFAALAEGARQQILAWLPELAKPQRL